MIGQTTMTNRLINETSPYLLQHAENPVDWYPWGPEALTRAEQEDKPIFLSIGYTACHWCHVMEEESFKDEQTATFLNQHFVSIKVDREERPDLDQIYMNAVVAMTGQGGWPMSVFLTPKGEPFFGGTYFPPRQRYGMPAFIELLESISRLWDTDRQKLLQSADNITHYLRENAHISLENGPPLSADTIKNAVEQLSQSYDHQYGGWGKAPRFPQPMIIDFLLLQAIREDPPNSSLMDIGKHILETMQRGGLYDVVGGGFHRYSTDDNWLVPHFEKMLYDNAQLALVYLHGFLVTREPGFLRTCQQTLDFVQREMTHPLGGFYSSLDADSDGEEGVFYTWALDEINAALPDKNNFESFKDIYPIRPMGNFEGKNILQRQKSDQELAVSLGITLAQYYSNLDDYHARLLDKRQSRNRPLTDDKALTGWNALMMIAFAEAGRYLQRPDYLETAQKNARFLLENLYPDGHLLRTWREGTAKNNAYLEDYAALIIALITLFQADNDPSWYHHAEKLTNEMVAAFSAGDGGFYNTREDHEELLVRPKEIQDNALPSGNALAMKALLLMDAYAHNEKWRTIAENSLSAAQTLMAQHPTAFPYWLQSLDFAISPIKQVVVIIPSNSTLSEEAAHLLHHKYRPHTILLVSGDEPDDSTPAIAQNRPLLQNLPTFYVCENFICQRPINSLEELAEQLQ
jgi:uncharacterized protein